MLFKHNADTKAANFKRKYDKKIEIIKENENLSCDEKNELYFKIIDKLQRVSDRLDKIEEIATFIHSSNEPLSRNQLLNLGVGCAGVVSLLIGSVGIANIPELANYPELTTLISTLSTSIGAISSALYLSNVNVEPKTNYSAMESLTIQQAFNKESIKPVIAELTEKLNGLVTSNFKGRSL